MELAGTVFKTNEIRVSLWNRALKCKTFCKECCSCVTWFKRKIVFFVTEKCVDVWKAGPSKEASSDRSDFLT